MTARIDRIAQVAQRYVDAGAYPAIEWLVRRDGKEWMRGRAGLADPLNGVAMPEKPIYRLYSMTKPVVSAIAAMLIEEGKLRLYDPVAAYIPKFAKPNIVDAEGNLTPARNVMLVEQLMSHRAGLSYGFLLDCPAGKLYRETDLRSEAGPLAAMIDVIADLPLAFEPGTKWRYSVGTDVLGRIVEIIEKKPLPQIVAERITGPLGLKDTGYFVPESERHRIMPMFGRSDLDALMRFDDGPQKLTPADVSDSYPADSPEFARGGYGLFSTADDYAEICDFLSTGRDSNGDILLSRPMLRFLWTNRIPESQMPLSIGPVPLPGYGFSLAGRVMVDPGRAVSVISPGEYGWSGAAGTFFWIDPEENMTGVLMTQYLGSKLPLSDDMRNAVYQATE